MNRYKKRYTKKRYTKKRYSKKRYSKKRYSKKRYSKKRYTKKRYTKKRYTKKRYSKKIKGGDTRICATTNCNNYWKDGVLWGGSWYNYRNIKMEVEGLKGYNKKGYKVCPDCALTGSEKFGFTWNGDEQRFVETLERQETVNKLKKLIGDERMDRTRDKLGIKELKEYVKNVTDANAIERISCNECQQVFDSRTKLFYHIAKSHPATFPEGSEFHPTSRQEARQKKPKPKAAFGNICRNLNMLESEEFLDGFNDDFFTAQTLEDQIEFLGEEWETWTNQQGRTQGYSSSDFLQDYNAIISKIGRRNRPQDREDMHDDWCKQIQSIIHDEPYQELSWHRPPSSEQRHTDSLQWEPALWPTPTPHIKRDEELSDKHILGESTPEQLQVLELAKNDTHFQNRRKTAPSYKLGKWER